MRAVSRLLIWSPRLRALTRRRTIAIDRSNPDYRAFALDRYSPEQQHEIVKLIARQQVITRGDIADALGRAQRKARLSGQVTGAVTGFGFVAMFALGAVAARHQPPSPAGVDQSSAAGAIGYAGNGDGDSSPGGLDEADREFFADLQAGRIATATAPAPPRRQPAPVAAPPSAPVARPAMAGAAPETAGHQTVIQLGAFADAAIAGARWQALATEFPSLRPLNQTVSAVAHGGHTLYRLRASGVDAASACSALAGAGTMCFIATDAG